MDRAMEIEYDPAKDASNLERHGVALDDAAKLLNGSPYTIEDTRRDYGEKRFIAYGWIEARLHVCVYTLRGPSRRIISLRKANRRELHAFGAKVVRGGDERPDQDRLGANRRDDR
jgi:uncharacterized DUF497 family protein